jgi:hypothetical protein
MPASTESACVPLNLTLPQTNIHMTTAIIDAIHAVEGPQLTVGAKLLDLSAAAQHDCPPAAHYRLVAREARLAIAGIISQSVLGEAQP